MNLSYEQDGNVKSAYLRRSFFGIPYGSKRLFERHTKLKNGRVEYLCFRKSFSLPLTPFIKGEFQEQKDGSLTKVGRWDYYDVGVDKSVLNQTVIFDDTGKKTGNICYDGKGQKQNVLIVEEGQEIEEAYKDGKLHKRVSKYKDEGMKEELMTEEYSLKTEQCVKRCISSSNQEKIYLYNEDGSFKKSEKRTKTGLNPYKERFVEIKKADGSTLYGFGVYVHPLVGGERFELVLTSSEKAVALKALVGSNALEKATNDYRQKKIDLLRRAPNLSVKKMIVRGLKLNQRH